MTARKVRPTIQVDVTPLRNRAIPTEIVDPSTLPPTILAVLDLWVLPSEGDALEIRDPDDDGIKVYWVAQRSWLIDPLTADIEPPRVRIEVD